MYILSKYNRSEFVNRKNIDKKYDREKKSYIYEKIMDKQVGPGKQKSFFVTR